MALHLGLVAILETGKEKLKEFPEQDSVLRINVVNGQLVFYVLITFSSLLVP